MSFTRIIMPPRYVHAEQQVSVSLFRGCIPRRQQPSLCFTLRLKLVRQLGWAEGERLIVEHDAKARLWRFAPRPNGDRWARPVAAQRITRWRIQMSQPAVAEAWPQALFSARLTLPLPVIEASREGLTLEIPALPTP
jgi:hypothetical protein